MEKWIEENDIIVSKQDVLEELEKNQTAMTFSDEGFERCLEFICKYLPDEVFHEDTILDFVECFKAETDEIAQDDIKAEEELQNTHDGWKKP